MRTPSPVRTASRRDAMVYLTIRHPHAVRPRSAGIRSQSVRDPLSIRLRAPFAAVGGRVLPCERKFPPRLPCRLRSCVTTREVRCSGCCMSTTTLWRRPGAIAGQTGGPCAPGRPSSKSQIATANRSYPMRLGPMRHGRRGNGSAPQRRKRRPTGKPSSVHPARPPRQSTMLPRWRRFRQTRHTVRIRPRHKGCRAPRNGWLR